MQKWYTAVYPFRLNVLNVLLARNLDCDVIVGRPRIDTKMLGEGPLRVGRFRRFHLRSVRFVRHRGSQMKSTI